MTLEEALNDQIHSIAGTLPANQALIGKRRIDRRIAGDAGLLGGGAYPVPGEVSLAHHGILFLDELPEFARNVLEVMRQPLEDGKVTISRAAATVTFPCQFMLVAAMNPCPCGYYGDSQRECRCTVKQVTSYRNRISGPLLDRIDIHIEVPSVNYNELASMKPGEPSSAIRERVLQLAVKQLRFKELPHVHLMQAWGARTYSVLQSRHRCTADAEDGDKWLNFSARAHDQFSRCRGRLLTFREVMRSMVSTSRAIQYRTLDREIW